MYKIRLIAVLALGLGLAASASAQIPPGGAATERAYLEIRGPAPDAQPQRIEGTATWRIADFGYGPAIEAAIRFPNLGDVIFVIEPNLHPREPQYSHRTHTILDWDAPITGLVDNVAFRSYLLGATPAGGTYEAFAISEYGYLLADRLDDNLRLLRSSPSFRMRLTGESGTYGMLEWEAGATGTAVIEEALAVWSGAALLNAPHARLVGVPAFLRGSRYSDPLQFFPSGSAYWERIGGTLPGGAAMVHFHNAQIEFVITFSAVDGDLIVEMPILQEDFLPTPGPTTIRRIRFELGYPVIGFDAYIRLDDGVMRFDGPAAVVIAEALARAERMTLYFTQAADDQASLGLSLAGLRQKRIFRLLSDGLRAELDAVPPQFVSGLPVP